MRDAFIRSMTGLAEADPMVTLITGDLGFGVLSDFARRFPKQFVNAGVAEQNMTAIAAGMALEGHKVYTYSIANFTTLRCLEQIRNDVCYHDANVTIVSVGGGFSYGQLGMSHFATEDLAILRALPGMRVVAPTDPWEAAELTLQLAHLPGPKYLRLDKGSAGLPAMPQDVEFGKARTVREGTDVTLIATGAILVEALRAAETLAEGGVSAKVLAIHTIKPLDTDGIIAAARQTMGIFTIEEHTVIGGLGSAVAECCMEAGVAPKVFRRIGLLDAYPTVVGDQDYLRSAYNMDAAAIHGIVKGTLQ
jgi:transketolase